MPARLLLLVTDLKIGGTPTVVRELAIRLRQRGHDVQVACLSPWGPVADQLRDEGAPVTALGATSAADFRIIPKFVQLLRDQKITHVLSFLVHSNAVAGIVSHFIANVRWFQSIQTTQEKPGWHWLAQQLVAGRAEKIIVPSAAVAAVAQNRSHVPPETLVVIPNAIDPADFPRVEIFKNPRIRLGFLGRLDPVKNVDALVEAMQWMNDLPIECHIYGDGSERNHLEKMADHLKVHDRVVFHGAVVRPQEALGQMDVLAFPSLGEGFGLVLIEAMASGIPIIAANSGAIPEIVQHEVNGLLVDAKHAELDIGPAVRRLIENRELREKLIENGHLTVADRYDWKHVLAEYERVLLGGTGC